MTTIAPKYTDAQRTAVEQAGVDRLIRPNRVITQLAAAGELTCDGERVAAFDMPESYVAELVRNYRRRKEGTARSRLAELPAHDAVEMLRRRLLNLTDGMIERAERRRNSGKPEEVREIARAVREIAAIPGPQGQKPLKPAPGHGGEPGRHAPTGLGGAIKRAVAGERGPSVPAPSDPLPTASTEPQPPYIHADSASHDTDRGSTAGEPGPYVRAMLDDSVPAR